jgi:hypothetical protein
MCTALSLIRARAAALPRRLVPWPSWPALFPAAGASTPRELTGCFTVAAARRVAAAVMAQPGLTRGGCLPAACWTRMAGPSRPWGERAEPPDWGVGEVACPSDAAQALPKSSLAPRAPRGETRATGARSEPSRQIRLRIPRAQRVQGRGAARPGRHKPRSGLE